MARLALEFHSKSLFRKIEVLLHIPTMNLSEAMQCKSKTPYQDNNQKFPLMILLCGFGESKYAWESHSEIVDYADKNKIALLMIGGENKWYLNSSPIENWYTLIEEEILDFLYGNFTCLNKDEPLYICGESMGGYGALYHYLNNIDKYKACISLSPATRPDGNLEEILKIKSLKELFLETKEKTKNIYLSVGTNDFIYNQSKEFNDFLISNNIGVNYQFKNGYDHSWTLWREEIKNIFNYLENLK